jgi:hypothetical protein
LLDTVLAVAAGKAVPAALVNAIVAQDAYDRALGRLPFEVRGFRVAWPKVHVCASCRRAFRLDGPAARTHRELSGHALHEEDRRPWNLPKE